MKVLIKIVREAKVVVDIGSLKPGMIEDALRKGDGGFGDNWGVYDIPGCEETVESIEVTEVKSGK